MNFKFKSFVLLFVIFTTVYTNPITDVVSDGNDDVTSSEPKLSTIDSTSASVSTEVSETKSGSLTPSTLSVTAGKDDVLDEEDAADEKEEITTKLEKETRRVPKASGTDEEETSEQPLSEEVNKESTDEERILPENHVIVETNSGDIEGFKQKVLDNDVYTFLGIPYATPPIGDLRFKLPELVKPWRRPYKALEWPPLCEQRVSKNFTAPVHLLTQQMSEDCLYLNIWTPNLDKTKLKPVMVWFHGGLFSFGSTVNEENDGKTMASLGDVVVVTFNYRLSAYGFLKMGISEAPGNMGLFDQNMALKWIHANINEFGGDSDMITVFGQGAGAFSIGVHIASPLSRNLFKRAILQSGSPVYLNFVLEAQLNTSDKLVNSLGCNNEDGDITFSDPLEALSCIKSQPTNSLKDAIGEVLEKNPLAYLPSVGGRMMPLAAVDTFADPTYYYDIQKEVMLGVNSDEGSLYLNFAMPDKFPSKQTPVITKDEAKKLFYELIETKWPLPESYQKHLEKFFADFDSETADSGYFTKNLYRLFSENMVTCPVTSFANNFAQIPEKSVYVYNFTHRSSRNQYADWLGVNTYEEVQFVFGVPIQQPDKYTPEEVEFSKRMLNTWVTFAKEGKPPNQLDKEWPKYDPTTTKESMILNPKTAEVTSEMDKNCQFFHIVLNYDNE